MYRIGKTYTQIMALALILTGIVLAPALMEWPETTEASVLAWLSVSVIAGFAGGVLALLGLSGPKGLRTRTVRIIAWVAMIVGALRPSDLAPILAVFVALTAPVLLSRHNPTLTSE